MSTSYEDVENEATQTPVDFDAGEKLEFAVHFRNKKINAEHTRSFVLDSPIEGWNDTFGQNPFCSATFICEEKEINNKISLYCFSQFKDCSKFSSNKL